MRISFKFSVILTVMFFYGCQTSRNHTCQCENQNKQLSAEQIKPNEKINFEYLNTDEKLVLASDLLNNDSTEQALELLDSIPESEQTLKFKTLKRDAINKTVVNLRYKVRLLYQKSLQQTGDIKIETLKQSKDILQTIIKKYPEYNDMYSIKNNLKQIERELSRRS